MDANHQDKRESKLSATEDKLWLPPLSPKDQRRLKRLQKKSFTERMGLAGKTSWDLIQLLLIPLVLAGVGFWFSAQQNQTSLQVSERQHQADLQIAATRYANDQQLVADQQQETTLKTYLDDMSNLLLNNKLLESKPGDAVRQVAKERTLTALRRLQAERNGIVLQFLQDAHLIGEKNAVIDLSGANLSHDDLRSVNLGYANLSLADLSGANLGGADLSYAILFAADLSGANLSGANLSYAYLSHANLSYANLSYTNLSYANLSYAKVTQAQLNEAKSLKGTIMPDGSKHP
jgi:uncharacterized protein YjbI with pentapeptide repeats